MGDDTVSVTFGGKIDELVGVVKDVNSNLDSIKTKASEVGDHTTGAFTEIREIAQGLISPIRGIRQNLGDMAEAFVAAFAVEKMKEFVEGMALLGSQVQTTMAVLGISSKQVGEFSLIAGVSGVSTDAMTNSLERLQVSLQKTGAPTSAVSQSLRALGLSAKVLQGIPLPEQLNKIADAVSKFADGGNKTAIVMNLLGRSGAQMIPILDQGRAGLDDLRQSSLDAATALSTKTLEGLEQVHQSSTTLSQSVSALGAAFVGLLGPGIATVNNELINLASGLSAIIQTNSLQEMSVKELQYTWDFFIAGMKQNAVVLKDVFTLNWSQIAEDWRAGTAELQAITDNLVRAVGTAKLKMAFQLSQVPQAAMKPQAPGITTGGAADNSAQKEADGEIKVLQEMLAQKKVLLDQAAAQYLITEQQKLVKLKDYTEDEYNDEKDVLERELQLGNLSVTQRQEVLNKLKELEVKHETDMIKINGDMVAAVQKQWETVTNALQSSFNGQLRGLLAGTTSFADAFKAITGDMIIFFIEQIEKMVFKWIVAKATELTVTQTTEAAKVAAVTTGATAGTLAETTAAMAAIQRGVAATFANASAFFALGLGPAAPAAAAGVSASVEATSVGLLATSAEQGEYQVSGGLYKLHDDETVLPAPAAQAFREMAEGGMGGGSHLHLHGQLIDGPSLQRFARDNAGIFAGALKGFSKLNPSVR